MAKGRPSKWVEATVKEPIFLGKSGITLKVWDKYGKKHKAIIVVSVGGIQWYPYNKKKAKRISWDRLEELV